MTFWPAPGSEVPHSICGTLSRASECHDSDGCDKLPCGIFAAGNYMCSNVGMVQGKRRAPTAAEINEQIATEKVEQNYERIEPIDKAMVPDRQGKKRWYGTHQFFTRRAWNIVQQYILNFAPVAGATVLDPFGGSGVTAVEAAILGRRGAAFDVNPFAVFYAHCAGSVYQYPLDPGKSELRPKMRAVMETYESRYPKKRMSDDDYLAASKELGRPTRKLLDKRVDFKTFEMHTPKQLHDLCLLKKCILEQEYALPLTRDLLMFVFSATVSKCNRTFVSAKGRKPSRGGARIFSSFALNLPPNPFEIDVYPEFQSKFKKLLQAKDEVFLEFSRLEAPPQLILERCAVQDLAKRVPSESVDYIFTDPPYGKLIPYLDLASSFCDWLDLEITQETREKDIVENFSMNRSQEFYYDQMRVAFRNMYETLKYNRWMTLVYAHKNTEYWDAIISACQDSGFEFVNAVYEKPEVIWSLTKKKNSATTFSGELYLNFRKANTPKAKIISILSGDFQRLLKNTIELAIVHNEGCATLEDIYADLVPVLTRSGLLNKFRQENIDIKDYLDQDFIYSQRQNGYELPAGRRLSSFIPIEDRVLFYVRDFLISKKNAGQVASFDEIISGVLPNLVNGNIPSRDSVLDVLAKIAVRDTHGNWMLSQDDQGGQIELAIPVSSSLPRLPPRTSQHNVLLWKLLFMGNKASMVPYLGRKEQQDQALKKSGMPYLSLLRTKMTAPQQRKIEQIDVIWTREGKYPEYAFEVEESTAITSAFERFLKLMEVAPDTATNRNLIIVAPKRRRKKLKDVLENSAYIGHPLYFENKIRILMAEDVDGLYESCKDHFLKISDLEAKLKEVRDI